MSRWIRRRGVAPPIGELVGALGGRFEACCADLAIDSVGAIDADATPALAPLWDARAVAAAVRSAARVLLVDERLADRAANRARWIHPRPRRAWRGVIERLYARDRTGWPRRRSRGGAWVHPDADVHRTAVLAPGAIVCAGATIGERVEVGPNATILHDVTIGARSTVGPSCVVGAEGFGLDAEQGDLDPEPIPHIGSVEIGERVGLGALVVVARGTIGPTCIGGGTRIDAHVQVGHNVRIGRGCILCAQVGVGGSTTIGDGVWIGGQAGIADHCRVGDGARIAAQSGVIGDIPAGAVYGGTPAVEHAAWMRGVARLHRETRGKGGNHGGR